MTVTSEIARDIAEGIAEFNCARYWEAHHGWEHAWVALPKDDPRRAGLQGAIMGASAFHLLEARPDPAQRLAASALAKLETGPALVEIPGLRGLLAAIARGEHLDAPTRAEIARQARLLRARAADPERDARYERAVARVLALGTGTAPAGGRSLDGVRARLSRLGLSIAPERVVVVAGTNGKGSTCAALDALLLAGGRRAGSFTSPHLVDFTERFRVAGEDVSRERFANAFERVDEACQGDPPRSQFEMLTLVAAWIFFSGNAPVELAVFEVGMGGLHDPVNALAHETAAIARIGLDHQAVLGGTLGEIARNKLGVVTPECRRVYHLPLPSEAQGALEAARAASSASWTEVSAGSDSSPALPGPRGAENAALALAVAAGLGIKLEATDRREALARVRWPGRMQRLFLRGSRVPVYLSGDHNPQGVRSLLQVLDEMGLQRVHFVAGVAADKDLSEILGPLAARPDSGLWLTQTPYKGLELAGYGPWLARARGANADPLAALSEAVAAAEADGSDVVVTGSLYLVGEVLRREP